MGAFCGFRESHLQSPPRFTVDLEGRNLLGDEAVVRVKERRRQVGPQRSALEVGDMQIVPRCVSLR
jgi:hypothetical protein